MYIYFYYISIIQIVREAQRLQLHNQYLINLAMNRIWRLNSTRYQRQQFINLASDAIKRALVGNLFTD